MISENEDLLQICYKAVKTFAPTFPTLSATGTSQVKGGLTS